MFSNSSNCRQQFLKLTMKFSVLCTIASSLLPSVSEITTYWSVHNNTDASPTVSMLPNINTMDGSTVESRIWENGDQCVSIKELKVINGGHDWPEF